MSEEEALVKYVAYLKELGYTTSERAMQAIGFSNGYRAGKEKVAAVLEQIEKEADAHGTCGHEWTRIDRLKELLLGEGNV